MGRKLMLTVVGVLLFAAGLTLVFTAMRSVMDVGGFCASGGPYEIRQECPDGAWLMVVGIFAGLIGTGLVAAGTLRGGPRLWVLAWPALFCALGWNFLEYAVDPPPPDEGLVWGWLVCAVVFAAMGVIPLVLVLANARSLLWGRDAESPSTPGAVLRGARPTAVAATDAGTTMRSTAGAGTSPTRTTATTGTTTRTTSPSPPDADADLVADLERLTALHRAGALNDDEFVRAKAARLAEAES